MKSDQIEYIRSHLKKPLILLGMMGTGKTHIGKEAAKILCLDFYDSDTLVEKKAGMPVGEIFESFGEEKFRLAEKNTILELLEAGPAVIATGGGAVITPETLEMIKSRGISAWLQTDIQDIMKRLEGREDRPLLRSDDPQRVLEKLMTERAPLYAQADFVVKTSENAVRETLKSFINQLYDFLKNDRV